MGFRIDAYAKVWEVNDKGNYSEARISISKKNKLTNQYETDFQSKVRLVGQAHNCRVKANDRIKIKSCDVSTRYNKETGVTYTNYVIFEIETDDEQPKAISMEDLPTIIDSDLPF